MPKLTVLKTGDTSDGPAGTSFLEFCQENGAPHDFAAPFGGYRCSGNGREFGLFGIEEYLEAKSICGYFPAA